jgi:hypothetical protein
LSVPKGLLRTLILVSLLAVPGVTRAQIAAAAALPTGPAVGQPIPEFEAVDQSGRRQTFQTLRGPKGLLLLFHRSADW